MYMITAMNVTTPGRRAGAEYVSVVAMAQMHVTVRARQAMDTEMGWRGD